MLSGGFQSATSFKNFKSAIPTNKWFIAKGLYMEDSKLRGVVVKFWPLSKKGRLREKVTILQGWEKQSKKSNGNFFSQPPLLAHQNVFTTSPRSLESSLLIIHIIPLTVFSENILDSLPSEHMH